MVSLNMEFQKFRHLIKFKTMLMSITYSFLLRHCKVTAKTIFVLLCILCAAVSSNATR